MLVQYTDRLGFYPSYILYYNKTPKYNSIRDQNRTQKTNTKFHDPSKWKLMAREKVHT